MLTAQRPQIVRQRRVERELPLVAAKRKDRRPSDPIGRLVQQRRRAPQFFLPEGDILVKLLLLERLRCQTA